MIIVMEGGHPQQQISRGTGEAVEVRSDRANKTLMGYSLARKGVADCSGVDQLLRRARRGSKRLTPAEVAESVAAGALLVDTRTAQQRTAHGELPGAVVIDRTVLEWRLDPGSESRIPEATGFDVAVRGVSTGLQLKFGGSVAARDGLVEGHGPRGRRRRVVRSGSAAGPLRC